MSATFRSFAIRNYRIWFAGVTVSNFGTWMQRTAQDWIVLTHLTDNDATWLGITMALQFGPQLVLSPWAGLVADLFNRRRILLVTQAVMATLGLALALLTLFNVLELWMILVLALLLGIASSFESPARQAFVSELVPPDYLSNAVGLNAASFNTARLAGPAVAGLLTAAIGAGWVFGINAATFGGTILAILLLKQENLEPQERAKRKSGQIKAGFKYIRKRGDLILVFLMVALMGTFGMNFAIFISTMSVQFGGDAWLFGLLSSALGFGSLLGALGAARRKRPRLKTTTLASAAFGVLLIAAMFMPNPILYGIILAPLGFAAITTLNNSNAYVQTTTAPSYRGRVMSLYLAIFMGGSFLGAPIVGFVANTFGPRWGMGLGAAAALLAALAAAIFYIRTRELRLRWEPARRWPIRIRSREAATREIAVIDVEAQRR